MHYFPMNVTNTIRFSRSKVSWCVNGFPPSWPRREHAILHKQGFVVFILKSSLPQIKYLDDIAAQANSLWNMQLVRFKGRGH